jgi:hypothetical protein
MAGLRVEVTTDLSDVRAIILWRLSRSWLFLGYCGVVLLAGLAVGIAKRVQWTPVDYQGLLCTVVFLWSLPVIGGLGLARQIWKQVTAEGKREVWFEEDGVRIRTELTEVFYRWAKFTQIGESGDYLFGLAGKRPSFVLCKRRVDTTTLGQVREFLQTVPIGRTSANTPDPAAGNE